MSAKPITVPVHTRLPEVVLAELDEAAAEEFESRGGMIAKIVMEWLKDRRIKRKQAKR